MSFDLLHIWGEMGLFARAITLALALMATASLAVFVERLWFFGRSARLSMLFGVEARALLEQGDYDGLMKASERFRSSPLASMLGAALRVYLAAVAKQPRGLTPIELTKRELARRTEVLAADIRRGFSVLASVGSVAPFVGLLGTVVGIIAAFEGIAREGSGGIGAVSAGIAEALVVTALGLLVAIPAVLAFNYLSTRADHLTLALEQSRGELVDHLEADAPRHIELPSKGEEKGASGVEYSAA